MGLSSSTLSLAKGNPGRRPKAPDTGPFSQIEFDVLKNNFRVLAGQKASKPDPALSRSQFTEWIHLENIPSFGNGLFQLFSQDKSTVSFQNLVAGVRKCIRCGPRSALQVMFQLAVHEECPTPRIPVDQAHRPFLLHAALCAALVAAGGEEGEGEGEGAAAAAAGLGAMLRGRARETPGAAPGSPKFLYPEDFCSWASDYMPLLHLAFGTFMERILLTPLQPSPSQPPPPPEGGPPRPPPPPSPPPPPPTTAAATGGRAAFAPPRPLGSSPGGILQGRARTLALLAAHSAKVQGPWAKLYDSREDGTSFNRVCHKALGYGGPTLVLVRDEGGAVFGGLAPAPWREGNEMYGGGGTRGGGGGGGFLFRLEPEFRIYPARVGGNENFMYLNLKGFSLPHGMGMGGSIGNFRFFLPEMLEDCSTSARCLTFENGELSSSGKQGKFQILDLEVWGCGGSRAEVERALGKQLEVRETAARNIEKARKVDKAAFLDNAFDREFLLGKTFASGARGVAADVRGGEEGEEKGGAAAAAAARGGAPRPGGAGPLPQPPPASP